jgi:hypothetical protein
MNQDLFELLKEIVIRALLNKEINLKDTTKILEFIRKNEKPKIICRVYYNNKITG